MAFPVKWRTGLERVVGVVFQGDVLAHDLFSQSSGQVASSFLVLSHAKVRGVTGCGGNDEKEQCFAPRVRVDDYIVLSGINVRLVSVQIGSSNNCTCHI